jgi:hypothetical protein
MERAASRLSSSQHSEPLDYGLYPFAIRLLSVSPELLDGHIQVETRQAPPETVNNRSSKEVSEPIDEETKLSYQCLPYTWGELSERHEILLNNYTFRVRDNLYEFLDRARRSFSNENLWIDAVCIDRSNLSERERQVGRMGFVYKGADEVLI